MLYRRQWLVILILLFCLSGAAWAQYERQMSVMFQTGAIYPPGRWIPIALTLKNATNQDVAGTVETTLQTPAGEYEVIRPVLVPSMSRVQVDMLGKFPPPGAARIAGGKTAPAATFFWKSADGATLVREPLPAIADSSDLLQRPGMIGVSGVIVADLQIANLNDDFRDPIDVAEALQSVAEYPFTSTSISPEAITRRSEALDACRMLILDQAALPVLDPLQRQALLDHVRSGATLLVIATDASIAESWIGPLLPMDFVGQREVQALETQQFGVIPYRRSGPKLIGVARPGAQTVASDAQGVLASFTEIGFGRVALIAFPLNALDNKAPGMPALWANLVGTDRKAFHDPNSPMASSNLIPRDAGSEASLAGVLPSMVGAKAPPWGTAAIIALAYTGTIALMMLVCGAKYRPGVLVGCVVIGVLLAGGVMGMSRLQTGQRPLTLARIAIVDQTNDAMQRDELITFFGQDRKADINFSSLDGALPEPVLVSGVRPPRMTMFPLEVQNVSASTGNYATVWKIHSRITAPRISGASLQFGPDGASLSVDSAWPDLLESPRLLFNGSAFSLSGIAPGSHTQAVGSRNVTGDFSNAVSVIADEQSKIRTNIIERIETRLDPLLGRVRQSSEPRLVGFAIADEATLKLNEPFESRGQTLVRGTVGVRPTPVGTTARFDPGFAVIRTGAAMGLPYRQESDAWTEATQGGPWLLAIAPPEGAGTIDPKQLTLDLDVRNPGFDIELKRGQCRDGKVMDNPSGPSIAHLEGSGERTKVTIDLAPNDFDANGWVWLRLSANPMAIEPSAFGMTASGPMNWRVLRFDPTLSGVIVGPPRQPVVTWPENAQTKQK